MNWGTSLLFATAFLTAGSELLAQTGGLGGPLPGNQQQLPGQGALRGDALVNAILKPATLPRVAKQLQAGIFEVTDTRPLEIASELLSRKLGIAIAFEEAAWVANRDVMRAGDHPDNPNKSMNTLVPRGGTLIVTIPPATGAPIDPVSVVQGVLDNQRIRNGSEFKLVRIADKEFSIVPSLAEDATGKMVQQVSPLDSKISFPDQERSLGETITLILDSVHTAAGVRVIKLFQDSLATRTTRVRIGANNELARDVLARTLRIPGGSQSTWNLRFDPQGRSYGILFRPVEEEILVPQRGMMLKPLTWPK